MRDTDRLDTGPGTGSRPRPPLSPRATFGVLLVHVRRHRGRIAAGWLLGLAGAAAVLVQPLAAKELIDDLGQGELFTGTLIMLSGLVLLGAVLKALSQYVLAHTAESIVRNSRHQLVARLLRLKVGELERTEPGDLLARVTSDTTLLRQVTTQSTVSAVNGVLTLAGVMVMMGRLDPLLLGVTVGVITLVGGVITTTMPRISRATLRAQASVGAMGAVLERALGAFRTVKASGAEDRETAVVRESVDEAWRNGVQAAKWQSVMGTSAGLSVQMSFLAVLGVGGARVASGTIGVSTLVAFLLFLFYLMEPISQLIQATTQFHVGAAAVARLREIDLLETDDVGGADRPARATALPDAPVTITFENVVFRYRPELPDVHRGVDFTAPSGHMTAVVGPSGAGKSTVFALIERFYEPTGGRVLVDGHDVLGIPLPRLRAAIGYIEQDAPVLSGTLRENLVFAAPDAGDDRIHEALARTRLDEFVRSLPQGLDTHVGHRGTKLSGGERQRLAVARALLRRPRLLLLDEATSQLDATNEQALRDVVADLVRETTVIVIAHRLSTVTMADRIVVMDRGRVRAVGRHEELIAQDVLYRQLAATQLLLPPPGEHLPVT
ncbi:ABC transporter ATP-binding protein [Streptomyces capillispiralis]|uniref:ABC-type multidrug transport system fused ATPase/permease subunit n=1 Tax=Streptomyces capillispiralis TaxID=68182 RepID=A0A561TGQ1_9ACTN|nr:ABC transporter ATP-binding protein [Streptomyces capillispiralis]TWF86295.1 ABC-type multidrug transport system fused ATPase/permease subunit [Streptomyces capillispiralis]GHH91220.1 putative ABC transporter ATP-binding protein [Streptomyces capillispiralis]